MVENSTPSSVEKIKDLVLAELAKAGDEEPFNLGDSSDSDVIVAREMHRLLRRKNVFEKYTLDVYIDASTFERYSQEYSELSRNFIRHRRPNYLIEMDRRSDSMSRIRSRYEPGGEKSDSAILFQTAVVDITSFNRIVADLAIR